MNPKSTKKFIHFDPAPNPYSEINYEYQRHSMINSKTRTSNFHTTNTTLAKNS